jgi:FAD:protein FMN transferase
VLHHLEEVMGTVVVIDVYADDRPATLPVKVVEANAALHRADSIFSTWRPDSPISRLRRGEITVGQLPPEATEVLRLCAAARDLSQGWFDPWAMPGGVDPTGYVKGWAAQQALNALWSEGISGALVNAAGDVASAGGMGPAVPFRIGIASPFAPRELATIIELTGAVATSGCYERGQHLIDPFSGRPAAGAASATVTGPDLGLADALATALAVAGDWGLAWIDPIAGYEAFVIDHDDGRRWTDGFPFAAAT